MKKFHTDDKLVSKFIHSDKSETAIKYVSSCDTIKNPVTGKLEINSVDRNKYSIFISASAGCPMNCTFCYLTIDQMPFQKLSAEDITKNIKEAIRSEAALNPTLKNRYVKLCWMGMGEAILNPQMVHDVTLELLEWIMANGFAKGLDGVDLSTILPSNNDKWIVWFQRLDIALTKWRSNPNNKKVVHSDAMTNFADYTNRSRFRLFYSIHSAIQGTRDQIIPKAASLQIAAKNIRKAMTYGNFNIIFHHMFLDGTNDTEDELIALIDWMTDNGFQNNELRILRYNKHDRSPIHESDVFEKCICILPTELSRVKVQISAGKEVKSACGQFIFNDTDTVEQYKTMK